MATFIKNQNWNEYICTADAYMKLDDQLYKSTVSLFLTSEVIYCNPMFERSEEFRAIHKRVDLGKYITVKEAEKKYSAWEKRRATKC